MSQEELKPLVERLRLLMSGESALCKTEFAQNTLMAAIEALRAQDVARAPEGYVLVPIAPTHEMLEAGRITVFAGDSTTKMDRSESNACYASMLAAAPAAPAAPAAEVPDEVRQAIERMCMPLDESRLSGETAKADARCMKIIRDYVLGGAAPAVAPASDELASMTRIFHAACADLGAINEALGLDPDDGGAEPILDAIAELKRERDQWVDANYAAPAQAEQQGDGLRAAVRAVVSMLKNGEYAEYWAHFKAPGDPDAAALENAITDLVNRAQDEPEEQQGDGAAIGKLVVKMDSCDGGQSLAPQPKYKIALAYTNKAAEDLPLGEYPIYTHPAIEQPSARVALSDEEIERLAYECDSTLTGMHKESMIDFARAILAASAAQTGESK